MVKTVKLNDESFAKLKEVRVTGQSFEDTINRLITEHNNRKKEKEVEEEKQNERFGSHKRLIQLNENTFHRLVSHHRRFNNSTTKDDSNDNVVDTYNEAIIKLLDFHENEDNKNKY